MVQAYEYRKLRAKIVEKYRTQEEFAKAIGMSSVGVNLKLNGARGFSQKDIEKWADILGIKKEDYLDYFFA
ncbi:MAG: DUF739 family protein [Lachnospiraceae bacterium]|nr:DUF739 family protein [Lachnospiraceae bacterium]